MDAHAQRRRDATAADRIRQILTACPPSNTAALRQTHPHPLYPSPLSLSSSSLPSPLRAMATDSRTITVIGDYLEAAARSSPDVKDAYTELNALVQKK